MPSRLIQWLETSYNEAPLLLKVALPRAGNFLPSQPQLPAGSRHSSISSFRAMLHVEPQAKLPTEETARLGRRPLLTTVVAIYATLAILALTIPEVVTAWANSLKPTKTQEKIVAVAETVEAFSKALRLNEPYRYARKAFLTVTGKKEE